jgi:hypothetical protein
LGAFISGVPKNGVPDLGKTRQFLAQEYVFFCHELS